jgi:hypothetical protein
MEILQITANFPGKGECRRAGVARPGRRAKMLDVDDDAFGDWATGWARRSWFPIPTGFAASFG